jgi:hypothetical protein
MSQNENVPQPTPIRRDQFNDSPKQNPSKPIPTPIYVPKK